MHILLFQVRRQWYSYQQSRKTAQEALQVVTEMAFTARSMWLETRIQAHQYALMLIENEEEQSTRVQNLTMSMSKIQWAIFQLELPMAKLEPIMTRFLTWEDNQRLVLETFRSLDKTLFDVTIMLRRVLDDWVNFRESLNAVLVRIRGHELQPFAPNSLDRTLNELRNWQDAAPPAENQPRGRCRHFGQRDRPFLGRLPRRQQVAQERVPQAPEAEIVSDSGESVVSVPAPDLEVEPTVHLSSRVSILPP